MLFCTGVQEMEGNNLMSSAKIRILQYLTTLTSAWLRDFNATEYCATDVKGKTGLILGGRKESVSLHVNKR